MVARGMSLAHCQIKVCGIIGRQLMHARKRDNFSKHALRGFLNNGDRQVCDERIGNVRSK